MPTGYTAGILDGSITTFPQFAKLCMRNFGATIHMRDDDMDAEYTPRTPSEYHTEEIAKASAILHDAEVLSDDVIIHNKTAELEQSKAYHLKSISEAKTNRKKMNDFLQKIQKWKPPTTEHNGLKKFMTEQISSTIDFDCKTDYHDRALIKIESELKFLNAKSIREEMIAEAKKDIDYHTTEYNKDLERCSESNKWVTDLINSLT